MRWTSLRRQLQLAFSFLCLSGSWSALSQAPGVQYWQFNLPQDKGVVMERSASNPFSAIAIRPEIGPYPSMLTVTINGKKYSIPRDDHAPQPTYFLSVDERISALEIDYDGLLELYTINSGEAPETEKKLSTPSDDCLSMPPTIDQEDWRQGLPVPSFSRIQNTVTHHIVHHTAGSNSNTNYTQVVRDIYLYHTQVNGWSDIGYNFLVAQDGTIYDGRDPGSDLTEFEVVGAHFCGKNTGTLGVSMLGNFETATPTDEAMTSLRQLLAFSMDMLDIDPLASSSHRGETLDHLSGHRDGCSTLCPGANLYALLPELRNGVMSNIDTCTTPPPPPEPTVELSFDGLTSAFTRTPVEFVNTSTGYDRYSWVFEGGSPPMGTGDSELVTYQRAGHFDVTLIGYLDGQEPDSLYVRDQIIITSNQGLPLVYPNPVEAGNTLDVELDDPIVSVRIFSVTGQEVAYYVGVDSQLLIPASLRGYFLMRIRTQEEVFWAKLRVN